VHWPPQLWTGSHSPTFEWQRMAASIADCIAPARQTPPAIASHLLPNPSP